ncbi:hypothetical protein ACOBQJ_12200 [Pelotomaculum propionicicum]
MAETKIIVISRRWPQTLLGRFGQNLKLAPRNAGRKIFRTYESIKRKKV